MAEGGRLSQRIRNFHINFITWHVKHSIRGFINLNIYISIRLWYYQTKLILSDPLLRYSPNKMLDKMFCCSFWDELWLFHSNGFSAIHGYISLSEQKENLINFFIANLLGVNLLQVFCFQLSTSTLQFTLPFSDISHP